MNLLPVSILYAQDMELTMRLTGYLRFLTIVRTIDAPSKLETLVQQFDPTLLLMDLRAENALPLLQRIRKEWPDTVIIGLGVPRSDPALEADRLGVYALEDPEADRQRVQGVVTRAHAHLRLLRENRELTAPAPASNVGLVRESQTPEEFPGPVPLSPFSRAFRHFDNVEALMENMVEGVASCAKVARVGVFSSTRGSGTYRFIAGIRCLDSTRDIEISEDDPLARWMQINAHMVSRDTLSHIADPSERVLLKQALDGLGAEVILPLHGRERVIGWLFVGRRSTGMPFGRPELDNLNLLAEHVSIALENALLYERVAVQKSLADAVLATIPIGIVALGKEGNVKWINGAAETILERNAPHVVEKPAAKLGGRLVDILHRALRGEETETPVQWKDPRTKRSLSAVSRCLKDGEQSMGAVAIIHDLTLEHLLREEEANIERTSFWTELAAAMSHEVRNPLVAISTFAQLLPQKYGDAEFRERFSTLVMQEVARLNGIVEQINSFANHPKPTFTPLDIPTVLKKSVEEAVNKVPKNGIRLETYADADLPSLRGDEHSLVDCFSRLIVNSFEALQGVEDPSILVTAKPDGEKSGKECVVIDIQDNGGGISSDIREKLFSPFCTSKARGLGLGLPIARRTVSDHNGELIIDSSDEGTSVKVVLPTDQEVAKEEHEAHSRS